MSVLTSLPAVLPDVRRQLIARYGPIDERSEAFPFDSTRYYDRQMGSPISRNIFGFADLITPDRLAAIKRETNILEELLASEIGGVERPVNLDPGYLEESKIVLASTKNYYHRICIGAGMYAEVTMHWEEGGWKKFPWTFPDFRTGRYDDFFSTLRGVYRDQIRTGTKRGGKT